MSHEIIYYKQFIKVNEDNFVPMILSGSNNCTVFVNGRERRSRDWFPYYYMTNGKLYGTLNEMLNVAEYMNTQNKTRYLNDDGTSNYTDDQFGSYIGLKFMSNFGSYKEFTNFFKNGCKRAKTVEELTNLGITVCVNNSYISYDSNIERKMINVTTTDDLFNAIDEITEFYKHTDIKSTISLGYNTDYVSSKLKGDKFTNAVKRYNQRNEKIKLLNDTKESFQIKLSNGGYLVKLTKTGYKYVMYGGYPGKQFLTEKEGNTYIKKLQKRRLECTLTKITKE